MTTNDIEKAEILLCCKNGEKLLGVTDDKILLSFIIEEEKMRSLWYEACLQAGIKAISTDTAARIMAVIYVHGNNEAFTFNKKLLADIDYIKKAYHVDGGESPDADFVFALEGYVKELKEYYEQHKNDTCDAVFCNPKPDWAKKLFKENYNIILIN